MQTKAGFAAIVGFPNAGKSTLLNTILETKLSIVTSKPQTTRRKITGIYSKENLQIIFLDTPGILKPKYKLHKSMLEYVSESITEADVLIYIFDIAEYLKNPNPEFSDVFELLNKSKQSKICLINKIDLLKNVKDVLPLIKYFADLKIFEEIIPISTRRKSTAGELIKVLEKYIPESPFLFDSEILSTQNERFFVSEIIREGVFLKYKDEIPYSSEVRIVEFKERTKGKWFISAEIIVERDSQKQILIGEGAKALKALGEDVRKSTEEFLSMEVYIELFVKVRKNWRNNPNFLKSFGYKEPTY